MIATRISAFLLAITLVLFAGCKKSDNPVSPNTDNNTVSTGTSVDVVSTVISPGGGTITVNAGGSVIDGMTVEIPSYAYPDARTWSVSYAPITSHTLGADFNPISPLITITNGGGYADSPMVVRVPCTVPAGKFAMAFSYDPATGLLEGLPLIACDSNAVVFQTRHVAFNTIGKHALGKGLELPFAKVVISAIDQVALEGEISSPFTPGIDDWEFTNNGSWAAPSGICAGMSTSAMYYFDQIKPGTTKPLFNLFDSVHTTSMWPDNPRGIRFASMCQSDYMMKSDQVLWRHYFVPVANSWKDQYRAFAYSIKLSHQPQYVAIYRAGGGHALIVYKVNNNIMSVADPNWPGVRTRQIVYDPATTAFTPYLGGADASDPGHLYPEIYYFARTAIIGWDKLEKNWQAMQAGTIGDGCFPSYKLWVMDGTGYELGNALTTDCDTLPLQLQCSTAPNQNDTALFFDVYLADGSYLGRSGGSNSGVLRLPIGRQQFGFCIYAEANQSCSGTALATPKKKWVDFRWVTITRVDLTISSLNIANEPFSKTGSTDSTYTLRASLGTVPPAQFACKWSFGDGSNDAMVQNDSIVTHKFARNGSDTVKVTLINNATTEIVAEASAVAKISATTGTLDAKYDTVTSLYGSTQITAHVDWSLTGQGSRVLYKGGNSYSVRVARTATGHFGASVHAQAQPQSWRITESDSSYQIVNVTKLSIATPDKAGVVTTGGTPFQHTETGDGTDLASNFTFTAAGQNIDIRLKLGLVLRRDSYNKKGELLRTSDDPVQYDYVGDIYIAAE
jgi:hypothetical protein